LSFTLSFVKIETIGDYTFYLKMFNAKIRGIISSGFDNDKCYPGYDPEQYSKDFNRRSEILLMPAVL